MEEIKCKGNREIESYQFTKMELEMELLLFARNMNAEIRREQREGMKVQWLHPETREISWEEQMYFALTIPPIVWPLHQMHTLDLKKL